MVKTPIDIAEEQEAKSAKMIELLAKMGEDIDSRDNFGRTPLMLGAISGNVAGIKKLLEYKADANAKDNNGQTPLMYGVHSDTKTIEIVDILLNNLADPYARDNESYTALDHAAKTGNREVVIYILDRMISASEDLDIHYAGNNSTIDAFNETVGIYSI